MASIYKYYVCKKHIRWHIDYLIILIIIKIFHFKRAKLHGIFAISLKWCVSDQCFMNMSFFTHYYPALFPYGCVRMRKLIHFMKRYLDNNNVDIQRKRHFFPVLLLYSPYAINTRNYWHIWYRASDFIENIIFVFIWMKYISYNKQRSKEEQQQKSNKRFIANHDS